MEKFTDIIANLTAREKAELVAKLTEDNTSLGEKMQLKVSKYFSPVQLAKTNNNELINKINSFFVSLSDIFTNNIIQKKINSALKINLTDLSDDTTDDDLKNLYLSPLKKLLEERVRIHRVCLIFNDNDIDFYTRVRNIIFNDYSFKGIVFAQVKSEKAFVLNINSGNELLLFDGIDRQSLLELIIDKIGKYQDALVNLENNLITASEFDEKLKNATIIDENALSKGLCKLIYYLLKINKYDINDLKEEVKKLENEVLKQSSILLINNKIEDNYTLPRSKVKGIIYINEDEIDNVFDEYIDETGNEENNSKIKKLFVKEVKETKKIKEIHLKGFNEFDDENNNLLFDEVSKIDNNSIVIFNISLDDHNEIGKNQLSLIKSLKEKKNIIVGVLKKEIENINFSNYFDAIFITNGSSEMIRQFVLGLESPSGYLENDINIVNEENEIIETYKKGYGKNFGLLSLSDVKYDERGLVIEVLNSSNYDCMDKIKIYICENDAENNYLISNVKYAFTKNKLNSIVIPYDAKIFNKWIVDIEKYEFNRTEFVLEVEINNEKKVIELNRENVTIFLQSKATLKVSELSDCSFDVIEEKTSKLEKVFLPNKSRIVLPIILNIYLDIILIYGLTITSSNTNSIYELIILIFLILINIVFIMGYIKHFKEIKKKFQIKADNKKEIIEKIYLLDEVNKLEENDEDDEDYFELFSEKKKVHLVTEYVKMKEVCDNFIIFAKYRGLIVDVETIRSIIAAFASSKIIFVKNEDHNLVVKFLKILNEYFGNRYFCEEAKDNWNNPNDLLWKSSGEKRLPTNFLKGFISSFHSDNNLNIVSLDNVKYSNFKNYFRDFLPYLQGNAGRRNVYFGDRINKNIERSEENNHDIPSNLWYFMIVSEKEAVNIPFEISALASMIELQVKYGEIVENKDLDYKILTFTQFNESLKERRNNTYIDEETWKKVDRITEFINEITPFDISNRVFCRLEDYADAYLSCEVEEPIAMDSMLANKLLPLVLTYDNIPLDGENGLSELIDKVFGVDNTGLVQKTLINYKKMNENNN